MAKAATRRRVQDEQETVQDAAPAAHSSAAPSLDGNTRGKFVLFAIAGPDRVADGPVMRGFIETEAGKINVAGWKKNGRETGTDYLSLKAGNAKPRAEGAPNDTPDEWLIGPFYGRLFKETAKVGEPVKGKRYFGFIEDSVKVGEDPATHKGVYHTHWQIQVKAKADVSNDQKTHYINGAVHPRATLGDVQEEDLPF